MYAKKVKIHTIWQLPIIFMTKINHVTWYQYRHLVFGYLPLTQECLVQNFNVYPFSQDEVVYSVLCTRLCTDRNLHEMV